MSNAPNAAPLQGWLGVLGGMGPLATADFLAKLALATPARVDQEHIPVLVYGNCGTPDRTAAALAQGASPLPDLLRGASFLAGQGVEAIAVPCNSAHCWYEQVAGSVDRPVLHIVDACVALLQRRNPGAQRVAVLSTEGTARMGIYPQRLRQRGLEALVPTAAEFSALVSPGIALVKAGRLAQAARRFDEAAQRLCERGAQAVILGCTEIPLAMKAQLGRSPEVYVDSTEALVQAVLATLRAGPAPGPDVAALPGRGDAGRASALRAAAARVGG